MTDFGTPGSIPPPSSPAGRTGPAWEQPGAFFQRWIDTAKSILLDPQGGFRNVRRTGGLGAPLTYYAVGASPAIIGYLLFNLVIGGMGILGSSDTAGAAAGAAIIGGGMVGMLLMIIVMYAVGFFIITGLVHLVLSLLGGAKHGYEATVRTFAYAHGSALPIAIIPFCAPIAGLWALVCEIFGLAEMQETTPVKAAIAILSPIAICCILGFLAWGAIMAMIMGSAATMSQ
jgi:hypothetical protein